MCDFYVVTPFTLATLFMRQHFDAPTEINVEPGSTHFQPGVDTTTCDTYMASGSGELHTFSSMSIEPAANGGTIVTGTWLYKKDLQADSTGNMVFRLAARSPTHSVALNISMISVSGVRWTSSVVCAPDQTTNTLITDSATGDTGVTAATMAPTQATTSAADGATAAATQTVAADNTGLIVGAVIGGLAVLALGAIVVALLLRRARRR